MWLAAAKLEGNLLGPLWGTHQQDGVGMGRKKVG